MNRFLLAAALALLFAVAADAAQAPAPRCFGAASSDPRHACHNPELDRMVVPTPEDALLAVDRRPCTTVEGPAPACWFGTPPGQGVRSVALVGDSHAEHWRTPLYRVAVGLHWTIYMVTHASCPFMDAALDTARAPRDRCLTYNRQALQWLEAHPEVSAIITSDHPGAVVKRRGETMLDAWVRGIRKQWDEMPATVEHVIALRDVPFIDEGTLPCVERAIAHDRDAGRACRVPRRRAIHHDPGPVAAQQVGAPRAASISMTSFFCDRRFCPPVIGGVLVYKDFFDHLTVRYGQTLGPYLLRAVRQVTAGWSPAASTRR